MANGIELKHVDDSGVIVDLTDGVPITSNAAWGRVAYDFALDGFGAGNDFLNVRWTFHKSGAFLELDGDAGGRLEVILNDSFVGLISHTFMVQGHVVGDI